MSKRILFEELVARREQREADKLKIGELRIPDSDRTLDIRLHLSQAFQAVSCSGQRIHL